MNININIDEKLKKAFHREPTPPKGTLKYGLFLLFYIVLTLYYDPLTYTFTTTGWFGQNDGWLGLITGILLMLPCITLSKIEFGKINLITTFGGGFIIIMVSLLAVRIAAAWYTDEFGQEVTVSATLSKYELERETYASYTGHFHLNLDGQAYYIRLPAITGQTQSPEKPREPIINRTYTMKLRNLNNLGFVVVALQRVPQASNTPHSAGREVNHQPIETAGNHPAEKA